MADQMKATASHLYGNGFCRIELRNLAEEPSHADTAAQLRERLLHWAVTTEDARPVPLPAARFAPDERSRSTT